MRVQRMVDLPCPVEEAWEVLTDWERQRDWMLDADAVTVHSGVREGVGVRVEVRTRLFGVPAFTERIEVIEWRGPQRLSIRHGPPIEGTGTWELSPLPGGCRFAWTEDVRLRVPLLGGVAARAYSPLMGWLMGRAMWRLRAHIVARGPRS